MTEFALDDLDYDEDAALRKKIALVNAEKTSNDF